MTFNRSKFAIDVKDFRGEKSLRDIEKETGVSFATLNRIEAGKTPELETFAALCKWMGVSLDDYFDNGFNKTILLTILNKLNFRSGTAEEIREVDILIKSIA